ncbi:hypothetical protein BZA70DRAFT_283749 [Myxozyma melibiosi]|uniref:Uncharacterized protein n=1 Tax=Myxozyma melibiosi TaxID=54550 RepID=A0ABR1EZV7_9ASCO
MTNPFLLPAIILLAIVFVLLLPVLNGIGSYKLTPSASSKTPAGARKKHFTTSDSDDDDADDDDTSSAVTSGRSSSGSSAGRLKFKLANGKARKIKRALNSRAERDEEESDVDDDVLLDDQASRLRKVRTTKSRPVAAAQPGQYANYEV